MKVTLNWLKQYVDFDWSADELAARLTMLGVEVEGLEKRGGAFDGIVVAQVITRDRHPNADKLSLCRVNDGKGERQIVCGAHNFKAGDKVPLILPGSTLPAKGDAPPMTIKVGKIRGCESQGMLCSPQELGLPDAIDGLLILREDATVGQPFAAYLGQAQGDSILDLEITPNRPDLNSVIGLAREIQALTGNPLRLPEIAQLPATPPDVSQLIQVRIEAPDLCGRYTARLIKGVTIGPSPDWLKTILEKVGFRSINNVVDVTNYVMLESGQPLHAFDFRLLNAKTAAPDALPAIVVRRAQTSEKFKTLDGQEHQLHESSLMIADETKAIALAGIMGGKNSEINSGTKDVLLESAWFNPQNVRASSKRLGLRTESSYRFERGADIGLCEWASQRAAHLILETAGGTLSAGVIDAFPAQPPIKTISLRHEKTNALLGIEIATEIQNNFLQRLGLDLEQNKAATPASFRIPTFRVDLKQERDLIEEITRLYGVDKVPSAPPRGATGSNAYDRFHDQLAEVRQLLVGFGLYEAQGQTLVSDRAPGVIAADSLARLLNPLSSDMNVLRPSLLPGLLESLRLNASHREHDAALFEIGRVFAPGSAEPPANNKKTAPALVSEKRRLALALTGARNPASWSGSERDAKFDIWDVKGILEEFFEQFGLRGVTYVPRTGPTSLFVESASVQLGKFELGEFGQLLPSIARTLDLRESVLLAELNLDVLIARRNSAKSFRVLPALPSVRRDIALLLPESTTHDSVLKAIKQAQPPNLESVELFDVYRGKNVPAGQKSVAYALTYRGANKNLTDAEVNAANEKVVQNLRSALGAVIRET